MIRLTTLIDEVRQEGYNEANAEARVCQDIVLKAIDASSFSRHITIKGGVVMRSITDDVRRATQDMDLDFIRYSLEEDSIRRFIDRLNCLEGIRIEVKGPIEELSQQEYRGKRVYITITDDTGYVLKSKLDLGVHKQMQIEQDEYCFDVCMDDEGASLLINSREQIFTEKLRSLLRFGPLSTLYKDIFDMCFLSGTLDTNRLMKCMDIYIFSDSGMREKDMAAVRKRIEATFANGTYRRQIERSRNANWMGVPVADAMNLIIDFLSGL